MNHSYQSVLKTIAGTIFAPPLETSIRRTCSEADQVGTMTAAADRLLGSSSTIASWIHRWKSRSVETQNSRTARRLITSYCEPSSVQHEDEIKFTRSSLASNIDRCPKVAILFLYTPNRKRAAAFQNQRKLKTERLWKNCLCPVETMRTNFFFF